MHLKNIILDYDKTNAFVITAFKLFMSVEQRRNEK